VADRGLGGEGGAVTPELSVLIVNYNTWRDCAAAVQSLRQNGPTRADGSPMPYEVIVVDNASPLRPPADIELLRQALADVAADQRDERSSQLILHDDNGGYSKGVNLCFRHSRGRWILVSNPDLLFSPGCISALQRQLERDPRTGCAVPKGYWDSEHRGKLPPNRLPTLGDFVWTTLADFVRPLRRRYGRALVREWLGIWEAQRPLPMRMMSGCLFLVERGYFESIGLMDERFPLYYEDSDLSRRIHRSGRLLVQVPDSKLVHFVNRSGQTDLATMWSRHDISRDLYFAKWYGPLGRFVHRGLLRLLKSRVGRALFKTPPDAPFVDLGASEQAPVLRFRRCERFLVLVTPDPRFHLAGGVLGSGDAWTPTPELFANFGPTVYWCRAYDLTGGRLDEIGTWRYERVIAPAAALPAAPAGPSTAPAGIDVAATRD
jgi:GT2 family glycosyltransferase